MISKQFFRTGLRVAKASASSSASPPSRVLISSALRSVQSTRYDATPIRWLSTSPLRLDEPTSSEAPAPEPAPATSAPDEQTEFFALYLSNLPFSVTEETLTDFIREHAPVKKVDVVRNSDGAARGFGFAKFATAAEAEAAVTAINGLDFYGRPIVAAISQRRPVISEASTQLFMSGFPTQGEADEATLRSALQTHLGLQPRAIRFHKFPGGFLKGTGHIEFQDVATLEQALAKLQELGPTQPVTVAGQPLTLVKARPLLASRPRVGRGGFGAMRGRGGFGGQYPGAGAYGAYGGMPMEGGYPGQPAGSYPGGGYQGQGYDTHYNPPYPPANPGAGGYGGYGGYGSQGGGGQGNGTPPY